jgi:hypothetical protein
MLRKSRSWDIRCPDELRILRSELRGILKSGQLDRIACGRVMDILAKEYHIKSCIVMPDNPPKKFGNNVKAVSQSGCLWMIEQIHWKTAFHEFYHLLDHRTKGKYISSDHAGGKSSYANQFANRLWKLLKTKNQQLKTKKEQVMKTNKNEKIIRTEKTEKKNKKESIVDINDNTIIRMLPKEKRAGTKQYKQWKHYKNGMTVAQAIKIGFPKCDIKYDAEHGYITLKNK